ncbi:MAG: NFACT family protein [Candidatus Izemoplasmatales bacterium]|nr:NFACT family protein [Candidatus Izemoplasmatales bacterium]MDD3865850.1 NFACT family protein [Candidatus Izemoplasmatales bacterium]
MSMDGRFLFYLAKELNVILHFGRINKIYQLSKTDFLFVVHANGDNYQLYISMSLQNARLHISKKAYDKPATPTGFCMLLRKHLENGVIKDIATINDDRIVKFVVENHNDFGEIVTYFVIAELMGKYANLIITDPQWLIVDCYKHVSPFEGQQRSFLRGLKYELPVDGKIAPSDEITVQTFLDSHSELTVKMLVDGIRGISPLFATSYIALLFNQKIAKYDCFKQMFNHSVEPTAVIINNKTQFYFFDIFNHESKKTYLLLSNLLDDVFFESGQFERTKQVSKYIYQLIKRDFDRNKDKLEKLTNELKAAENSSVLRIYGDLIRQYQGQINQGNDVLEVYCYELSKDVTVPLNRLLTPNQNAIAYYKKYKKNRQAISHLSQQIDLTNHEVAYFDLLMTQIETASLNDLLEITEELKANHYLSAKSKKIKNKHPNYDTYIDSESVEIVVGKNNIQNDYITHQLGRANEWWFHAKDIPGSHVLVRQNGNLSEATIRAAANLASYHSKAKMSSSVPVDYTLIKHVKKIPGVPGSFVTYSHQKTIFIDPDIGLIEQMTKKN